jgi:hypothetical protein
MNNLSNRAKVKLDHITYSNLWVNGNYSKFKKCIELIKESVVVIANKLGIDKKYPFEVKEFCPIETDCINLWETDKEKFLDDIYKKVSGFNDTLFFVSAGPLSEVIIEFLWNKNKSNRYIDVGSAIDEYTKGVYTRAYMIENQEYYGKICTMNPFVPFTKEDFSDFVGGWSYMGITLYPTFHNVDFSKPTLNILEFGCGDSSKKIYNLIKKYYPEKDIIYDAYESDLEYAINYDGIKCHLHKADEIDSVVLENTIYDLVLIDGPNGVNRKKWYSKIANNIQVGSVILIDDFDHYVEFENSLVSDVGSKWEYDTIQTVLRPIYGNKTWKIVKITKKK